MLMVMGSLRVSAAVAAFLLLLVSVSASQAQSSSGAVSGSVVDEEGAAVSSASVLLLSPQQAVLSVAMTDSSGHFRFTDVTAGTYAVQVNHAGFAPQVVAAEAGAVSGADLTIVLRVGQLTVQVAVTAESGQAQDPRNIAQAINVIPDNLIRQRSTAVLAQIADEEAGLSLQRTSPTIGAIFVRGLTGKNVAVYVDGARYTTSAMRGGINTFFNLNEPSALRSVEVLRGPNSAQYGSDSLGGTVNLVSRAPVFGADQPEYHADFTSFYTSADNSFGGTGYLSYGTRKFGGYVNGAARRVNTLRSANGLDGHAAVTRFLGLPSDVLGDRLPDTAFTQYSGTFHLNYAPDAKQQFIFHYQRSQQDGGKRYDQLLGGDGNLIADLRNLMLDFFTARYVKQDLGWFDNLSLTFSANRQREERVNQGGQGNPVGGVTHQYERTTVYGFGFYLDKRLGQRNTVLVGGDVYHEGIRAPAFTFNPVTNLASASRPRVPDRARYNVAGIYIQDVWSALANKLRFSAALRYNAASYRSRASNSPIVAGAPLWPNDSLQAHDFSGRVGMVATPFANTRFSGLGLSFNYSRGFRAPNITDLGTLGLTGDGFESDFQSASALGGTVGSTADASAISTGVRVTRQRSEVSNNFDLGFRFHNKRVDTNLTGFLIDINDAIVKQALILPTGAVGQHLGDQTITSQAAGGAVFVPLSTTPVLVRSNFTDARLTGIEYTLDVRAHRDWTVGGNFTLIRAKDKATGLAPNIEGGTPPATAFLRLRYEPVGKRYWIEAYSTLADRQTRLSSLDLSDRRTGATRSVNQIRDFFRRGACVRGLVAPGPDGRCGTGDETILIATGETLAQVQTRVLGATNAQPRPLFPYLPGYGLVNLRGGLRVGERSELGVDFENIGDKSHRGPSWGIDGPGRSVTVRYRYQF